MSPLPHSVTIAPIQSFIPVFDMPEQAYGAIVTWSRLPHYAGICRYHWAELRKYDGVFGRRKIY